MALCTFCDTHGPKVSFCSHGWNAHQRRDLLTRPALQESKSCEGCRSLPKQKRFLMSEDPKNRTIFVSGNIDDHPDEMVRSSLESIAKRCFSVESFGQTKNDKTGKDSFFVFSEKRTSSLVLAYNFIVPDNQYLRGFKRKYCLATALSDPSNLIESIDAIRRHMKDIVKSIKSQAEHRFKPVTNTSALVDHFRNRTNSYPLRNLSVVLDRLDFYNWLHYKFLGILNDLFHWKTETCISSALSTCSVTKVPTWDELKSAFGDDKIIFTVIRAALSNLTTEITNNPEPSNFQKGHDLLKVFFPHPSQECNPKSVDTHPPNNASIRVNVGQSLVECHNCSISVPELTCQMKAVLKSSSLPESVKLLQINRLKQELRSLSAVNV